MTSNNCLSGGFHSAYHFNFPSYFSPSTKDETEMLFVSMLTDHDRSEASHALEEMLRPQYIDAVEVSQDSKIILLSGKIAMAPTRLLPRRILSNLDV